MLAILLSLSLSLFLRTSEESGSPIKVGFVTYDKTIQFYNVKVSTHFQYNYYDNFVTKQYQNTDKRVTKQ